MEMVVSLYTLVMMNAVSSFIATSQTVFTLRGVKQIACLMTVNYSLQNLAMMAPGSGSSYHRRLQAWRAWLKFVSIHVRQHPLLARQQWIALNGSAQIQKPPRSIAA